MFRSDRADRHELRRTILAGLALIVLSLVGWHYRHHPADGLGHAPVVVVPVHLGDLPLASGTGRRV